MNYIEPSYPSIWRKHKENKQLCEECKGTKAILYCYTVGNDLSFIIHLHVLPFV